MTIHKRNQRLEARKRLAYAQRLANVQPQEKEQTVTCSAKEHEKDVRITVIIKNENCSNCVDRNIVRPGCLPNIDRGWPQLPPICLPCLPPYPVLYPPDTCYPMPTCVPPIWRNPVPPSYPVSPYFLAP